MNCSFTFNGNDFEDIGLIVTKTDWPLISTPRIDIQEVAFGKGVTHRNYYAPKIFNVNFVLSGYSESELNENIETLCYRLNTDEEKELSFDRFKPDIYHLARYTGGLDSIKYVSGSSIEGTIEFTCVDPLGFDATATVLEFDITSDPQEIVLNDSSNGVSGNTYSRPLIIIDASSGSNAITITNNTTGDSLTWNNILGNGEFLRIDSDNFTVAWSEDGLVYTNSMQNVTGSFPRLKGGVTNAITISGINSGGEIQITYRGRYL